VVASDDLLFSSGDLAASLEANQAQMQDEIRKAAEDYLLNVAIDEWTAHLADKYRIDPIVLRRDDQYAEDLGESSVDVRYDHVNRAIWDMNEPAYVAGRTLRVHVVFEGDAGLFQLQPSSFTFNPPRATISGQELVRTYTFPTDTSRPDIEADMNQVLNSIEQYVGWSTQAVEQHNDQLDAASDPHVGPRRRANPGALHRCGRRDAPRRAAADAELALRGRRDRRDVQRGREDRRPDPG
jgi:hypothetical protein